jgi:hypothetical protein
VQFIWIWRLTKQIVCFNKFKKNYKFSRKLFFNFSNIFSHKITKLFL